MRLRISTYFGVIIAFSIALVMLIQGYVVYSQEQTTRLSDLNKKAVMVTEKLSNDLATPIANYGISSYSRMLAGEMAQKDIAGIVLNDLNMADILGKSTFVRGQTRDEAWNSIAVTPEAIQKLKDTSWKSISRDILKNEKKIGKVTVYITDRFIRQHLVDFVQLTALQTSVVLVVLCAVAFFAIRSIVSHPLGSAVEALQNIAEGRETDVSLLERNRGHEIAVLAQAMRKIPETIQKLTDEQDMMVRNIASGKLSDALGNESHVDGRWKHIIVNTNLIISRFLSMLDTLPTGIMVVSRDHIPLYMNKVAYNVTGTNGSNIGTQNALRYLKQRYARMETAYATRPLPTVITLKKSPPFMPMPTCHTNVWLPSL